MDKSESKVEIIKVYNPDYPKEITNEEQQLKQLKQEMKMLYNEYEYKKAIYALRSKKLWKRKKKILFSQKVCASCNYPLSEENIKYHQVYCDECCSNDSCLAYDARLSSSLSD